MKYSVKKSENGTISLEAAIMMPIFIFVIMFIYGIMLMFSGQQLINHAMIQSSESLSIDSYAEMAIYNSYGNRDLTYDVYKAFLTCDNKKDPLNNMGSNFIEDTSNFSTNKRWYKNKTSDYDKRIDIIKRRFIGYLTNEKDIDKGKEEANAILKKYGVKDGIDGIDFSESEISDKVLTIKAKFKQEFIFNFQGLATFDREIVIKTRMW